MFLDWSNKGSLGSNFSHLSVSLLQFVSDLVPNLVLVLGGEGVPVVPHHVVLDGLLVPLHRVLAEGPHLPPDLARGGPGLRQLVPVHVVLHLFPGFQPRTGVQFNN